MLNEKKQAHSVVYLMHLIDKKYNRHMHKITKQTTEYESDSKNKNTNNIYMQISYVMFPWNAT